MFAIETSAMEWHAAMGAGVAQCEGLALIIAPNDERLLEQHGFRKFPATQLIGRQRAIPETEEHERVGGLRLQWEVVGHVTCENTAPTAKSKLLLR